MNIITEEMRYRQHMCEYAKKYGVTKAARKYHTNRQFIYRQLEKYDGTVRSLALRSRRPHSSPNAHTEEELKLIKSMTKRHGLYGLAEVYVRCKKKGYSRSFSSMCMQIRKKGYKSSTKKKKSYSKYHNISGQFPGDKVQIDIKYIPNECLKFQTYGDRYYQITAIDEYSRKRILKVVKEKSTFETTRFLESLSQELGFKIHTIQVDNGSEFVNDNELTNKKGAFELKVLELGYELKRIRPYSPWQNGRVERSHREDGKILYNRRVFQNEKELIKAVAQHQRKYNNSAKTVLSFKSPNQVVKEYFLNV